MRYNRYFMGLAICFLAFTSCDKYLDVTPKGYSLLSTTGDYDQWLNDPILSIYNNSNLELNTLADNVDIPTIQVPPTLTHDLIYTWAPQFFTSLTVAPQPWGTHYARINKYNTVLTGIDQATGGTEQQKTSLKAEALVGRAFEYFYLLNEYSQPYDAATAAHDPGVPFVTSNEVNHTVPSRGTAQEVYDRIIADINTAIPNLPVNNSQNRLRPDAGAAYSVLARIYLYARDYSNAAKNAQLALQHTAATMLDYNNLPSTSQSKNLLISTRADVLYGRTIFGSEVPVIAFAKSYDANDLRSRWYFSFGPARGNILFFPQLVFPFFTNVNSGTTVQEMKLILAEVAARNGDAVTALQYLNELRIKRFSNNKTYQPLDSEDLEVVLGWVLRERTFEFPFHGLRWFDMRRLDKENRMPTVFRYDAKGNVIATLPPHSPKYTLQIPVQELQFNPGMVQNSL